MSTMATDVKTTKSKGERFFDRFILAGLIMNGIVVLTLVGVWVYKTFLL